MSKHALTLVNDSAISAPSALLSKLQAAAIHQVALIRRTESEAAQRAILLGLTLWRIKASMKGTFTGWLKKDFDSLGYRQARYYMSGALEFVEKTKATLPEFLALPGDQTELALDAMPDAKARQLMSKIEKFVGKRSLTELFDDLGIKESAKKKRLRGSTADAGEVEDDTNAAASAQDRFNEIAGLFESARKATADKANWLAFSKEQHLQLKSLAEETAGHLADLCTKTHGRAAKR
jgi:hypothetical protein